MSSEAAGVSGSAIGSVGDLYTGNAQATALQTQATQNQRNAQLALEQGQYDSMRVGMQVAQKVGAIHANYGASGVESTSGSVLDVLNASAINGEMDTQNILKGAQVKAINFENEASMENLGAQNAKTASYFNALSSLTMGSGKAFGQAPSSTTNDATDSADETGAEDGTDSGAADTGVTSSAGEGAVSDASGEEALAFA